MTTDTEVTEALGMYCRILELTRQFQVTPPFLDDPDFKEWDKLRTEFRSRWPEAYMRHLD